MPKRTIKRNYVVSTYPCNGGYVTETISKYGEMLRSAFDFNISDAERRHANYLHDI